MEQKRLKLEANGGGNRPSSSNKRKTQTEMDQAALEFVDDFDSDLFGASVKKIEAIVGGTIEVNGGQQGVCESTVETANHVAIKKRKPLNLVFH
jgi:hypothetical protein